MLKMWLSIVSPDALVVASYSSWMSHCLTTCSLHFVHPLPTILSAGIMQYTPDTFQYTFIPGLKTYFNNQPQKQPGTLYRQSTTKASRMIANKAPPKQYGTCLQTINHKINYKTIAQNIKNQPGFLTQSDVPSTYNFVL